jgi:hypothetical protein
MVFNSYTFIAFFAIMLLVYNLRFRGRPERLRYSLAVICFTLPGTRHLSFCCGFLPWLISSLGKLCSPKRIRQEENPACGEPYRQPRHVVLL